MNQQQRINELEVQLAEMTTIAETDPLTGLFNRRGLANHTPDDGGWYVVSDLNGFKIAQDGHEDGHSHGNLILKTFSFFLENSCRSKTEDRVVARIGGDEFAVWCPNQEGAQRIKKAIRKWRFGKVTVSAGMGEDLDAADVAMYLRKKAA